MIYWRSEKKYTEHHKERPNVKYCTISVMPNHRNYKYIFVSSKQLHMLRFNINEEITGNSITLRGIHSSDLVGIWPETYLSSKYNGACHSAAIARATILVPCHVFQSPQLIGRLGTRRFHLRVPDLPISCSDFTQWLGTRMVVPIVATRVTCPFDKLHIQHRVHIKVNQILLFVR